MDVYGVGPNPTIVKGHGTVILNFKVDGHMIYEPSNDWGWLGRIQGRWVCATLKE